ncbi:hypothetical protein F4V57_07760 [Acinetobacter qingfengensis]|uniref:Uncharacterized protein n=1 Tax=Acinetobacter qingfengensis TaxID=1262585 RepID=A0A1E7QYY4_9GAMM|nr:DUF6587 family protein [Acinetobacter qingfengensis]KAA8733121.1 hypothetical protein F4V57_07760 [Acinetobacter qingfengensis]OEY92270.1 hypothetical protein BJI46_05855 [Acinetobacter qingfengensis]
MIQYLIITAIVLWSCVIVFNKLLPKTANKTYTALADSLHKMGWVSLADKLRPKKSTAGGCGAGCGCDSNDTASIKQHAQEVKTIKWK